MSNVKQVLQILSAKNKSDIGKKSGQPYSMNICQCVLTQVETGELLVGELTQFAPAAEMPVPGYYEAEFKIGVDFRTKKVGAELVALVPVSASTPVKQSANAPSSDKGAGSK